MKEINSIGTDVVVVGAGISGLALALGLAQREQKVIVIDIGDKPAKVSISDYDSRIYALNDTSISLLKRLKVWDSCFQDRIQKISAMVVKGDRNGVLTFETKEKGAESDSLGVIVESRNIFQALFEKASNNANIQFLFNTQVEKTILQNGRREIDLDTQQKISCSLLVASDGLKSKLRRMMNIEEKTIAYEHSGLVANFQSDQAHQGVARQWFLADGDIVALLPLPENQLSLVWSTPHNNAQFLRGLSPVRRIEELYNKIGFSIGQLREITPPQIFPLQLIQVKHIDSDRFILCGDAAHGVHPMAGQGLNLGLADVHNLLTIIDELRVGKDIGERKLLRAYARVRKEPVFLMQLLTHSLYQGFHMQKPWAIWARNIGMSGVNSFPGVKRLLLKQAGHA